MSGIVCVCVCGVDTTVRVSMRVRVRVRVHGSMHAPACVHVSVDVRYGVRVCLCCAY